MQKTIKTLLIIGWGWPEPNATAAGVRMWQLIRFFKAQQYTIVFAATSTENEHSAALNKGYIITQQIALNSDSFNTIITELQPSITLFDRFLTEEQFGWRVAQYAPKCLRILDTEDLHSLRHVREECIKKNIPFTIGIWQDHEKTKREIASIYRSDLSLIISNYEVGLLKTLVYSKSEILHHLPFMLAKSDIPAATPSFEQRTDFIFIGGGKHSPNTDAIQHLKTTIWPLIKQQLPDTKLHIYGAYLPQHILQLNTPKSGFYVHGKAAEVQEVMQSARVCLAPLRFGAGIKGKLLHAMQFGTPSVTTSVGAEGMHAELSWNGRITDVDTDFVSAAKTLYTDKNTWQRAQHNGYDILEALYKATHLEKNLHSVLQHILGDIAAHRRGNYVGGLLQHHTMQSTKYMSKWIQEKNNKDDASLG